MGIPRKAVRFILLTIVACACRPNTELIQFEPLSYYPIATGKFTEYEVTKTTYALSQNPQTKKALVRESIGDSFADAAGQVVFRLNYATNSGVNHWKLDSVNTVWQTVDKVFGVESGQIIVKLSLPINERNVWNGNAYNFSGERRYHVKNVDMPFKAGPILFPKTVTVVRQNDSTLISQRKHIEIYAEGVGLIQKEISYLNFCYSTDCKTKGIINSGWSEISVIKNYGK